MPKKKKNIGDEENIKNLEKISSLTRGELTPEDVAASSEENVSDLAASAAQFAKAFSDDVPLRREPQAGDIDISEFEAPELEAAEIETEAEGQAESEAEAEMEADEILEPESPVNYVEMPDPHVGPLNEMAGQGSLLGSEEGAGSGGAGEQAFEEEEDNLPSELAEAQVKSIVESVLFASTHPVSFAQLKALFQKTNIDSERLRDILTALQTDYAGGERGINLEEVGGGYQLRTKLDNAPWIKRLVKGRSFRLSGPALEVLSIVAYKQPVIKNEVDQIRGVESGHLLRALMEKDLVRFAGKSELPGKPMQYGTTKNFLELFGLRNIRELPTLSEIDELLPEGIGELHDVTDDETLSTLSDKLGLAQGKSYSESESELLAISDDLSKISTSSEFFEQEKKREKERREQERAQDLRERKIVGETLSETDERWLARYEERINAFVAEVQGGAMTPEASLADAVLTEAVAHVEAPPEDVGVVPEVSEVPKGPELTN